MEKKTYQQIVAGLKTSGCRITNQRLAITEYLAERDDHPGVRQIHDDLQNEGHDVSLATIYNTLEILVSLKLINELDFDGKENRYDTNISPHINLVCTVCGSITDYPSELKVDPKILKKEYGFITSDYRLEYRGICSKCQ